MNITSKDVWTEGHTVGSLCHIATSTMRLFWFCLFGFAFAFCFALVLTWGWRLQRQRVDVKGKGWMWRGGEMNGSGEQGLATIINKRCLRKRYQEFLFLTQWKAQRLNSWPLYPQFPGFLPPLTNLLASLLSSSFRIHIPTQWSPISFVWKTPLT